MNELELAKQIINKFIESCSHDLRSPLTSMEGLLMIASRYSTENEVNECFELMNQSIENMKEIIKSLGEYTANMQRELEQKQIYADELVYKVLNDYKSEIQKSGVQIIIEIDQANEWLSDFQMNYLILKNVIGNAIKFCDHTKANKNVTIQIKVVQGEVRIQIQDNGIGIVKREFKKIFLPFLHASSRPKGSGLGLFLSNAFASRMNAKLLINSIEQEGTTVNLIIPNRCSI